MTQALLVLPHQLFADHPGLERGRPVYLFEDQLFFGDWNYPARFHAQKLILHRASMRAYAAELGGRGMDVRSVDHAPSRTLDNLFERLAADGVDDLLAADPVDFMAEKRLRRECRRRGVGLTFLPTPMSLCPEQEVRDFFARRPGARQTEFYIRQRKRLGILLEGGRPAGGKWTHDTANRKRLPDGMDVPPAPAASPTPELAEARDYVRRRFPDAPGAADGFGWPVTRSQAMGWLADFCDRRLAGFGDYQDALSPRGDVLFHSGLSSSLNIGLLTPGEVLDAVLAAGERRRLPVNEVEGFVRQVLGWREYVRAMYGLRGVEQRNANFFGHQRPMPRAFYDGTTGLPPVDEAVRKLHRRAYAHHIERLMVLGNAMLLCGIAPAAAYTWFMELFIDAYDWVMVPNVYAMSQFADGGSPRGAMMTKPYLSGSAYLRRMGEYPRGSWEKTWDGLFWRFVHLHREFFLNNPRTRLMAGHLRRMSPGALAGHLKAAESFLETLW